MWIYHWNDQFKWEWTTKEFGRIIIYIHNLNLKCRPLFIFNILNQQWKWIATDGILLQFLVIYLKLINRINLKLFHILVNIQMCIQNEASTTFIQWDNAKLGQSNSINIYFRIISTQNGQFQRILHSSIRTNFHIQRSIQWPIFVQKKHRRMDGKNCIGGIYRQIKFNWIKWNEWPGKNMKKKMAKWILAKKDAIKH